MVKSGASKSRAKGKSAEVDEEQTLDVINNPDFLKMRALQKDWPTPTTSEADLGLLVAHGLLQPKALSNYSLPGEHVVPTPSPDQSILFVHFVRSGICFPPSDFLLEFLQFFGLQLHHLSPNGVLYLSAFVHLCEVFIGVPPCLLLFRHFFRLKLADGASPSPFGCCSIQARQGKTSESFNLTLIDKQVWADKWFYVPKPAVYFSSDLSVLPTATPVWSAKISDPELAAIHPLLDRLALVKEYGLTGNNIVASFIRRQVQPLMQREHFGFEYTEINDSSHIKEVVELSDEELIERMEQILASVPCTPPRVVEYDAGNPPPEVCLFFSSFFCLIGLFL